MTSNLPDFLKRVAEKFEAITAQRLAENAAWRSESRRKAKCARCDRLNKTAGSKYCPTCKALIEEDGYAS